MAGGQNSISDDLASCEPPTKKVKAQRGPSIVAVLQRVPSESRKVPCPACSLEVPLNRVNRHLDADCRVIERPSHINSDLEPQEQLSTEKATEELSRRFTERLDPGVPEQFGDKLKGLVANRRASRSFKSSRDRRRRSSFVIHEEGNSEESLRGLNRLESQNDGIVGNNDVKIRSTEKLMMSGNEQSGDASSSVGDGVLASISMSEMDSEKESRLPYYLGNFVMVLDTVLCSDDGQLFNDEDLTVVNTFRRLSCKMRIWMVLPLSPEELVYAYKTVGALRAYYRAMMIGRYTVGPTRQHKIISVFSFPFGSFSQDWEGSFL